jgi:hypothetical protein
VAQRHGIDLEHGIDDATDPLQLASPSFAAVQGASVLGRVASGRRAGQRVLRIGAEPQAGTFYSSGPRQARLEGFDLHANTQVRGGDRKRLGQLCRYILRPPVAQGALVRAPDGAVLLQLRRPWSDGTRAIRFEPLELIERLAAMVPRPRANLLIYHGAFAARGVRHECRPASTALGKHAPGMTAAESEAAGAGGDAACGDPRQSGEGTDAVDDEPRGPPIPLDYTRPARIAWAELLRRTFGIDVLACERCGGRLRLVATIEKRSVIERVLAHLGLPTTAPEAEPARSLDWLPGLGPASDDWGA